VAAIVFFVRTLKAGLTRAVNGVFAEAGDAALAQMNRPLELTGDHAVDIERLHVRVATEIKSGSFKSGASNIVDIAQIHAQGFTAQPM
jgi:hypothetical protein